MASHSLLNLASLCEDSEDSSEDEQQTTDAKHSASTEAISHKSSTSQPKGAAKKKRSCAKKSAKKKKVESPFRPVTSSASMVQCFFLGGECIPMWPQYRHTTMEELFVQVRGNQTWLSKLISAARKSVLQGYEPQQEKTPQKKRGRKYVVQSKKRMAKQSILKRMSDLFSRNCKPHSATPCSQLERSIRSRQALGPCLSWRSRFTDAPC